MNEIDINAKIIWDYMLMHQEPRPMDAILALGASDPRIAERAADLFHKGYAPYIIFSGGRGARTPFARPEAEVFADIAIAKGVPPDKILKEINATNTGENIAFVKELLKQKRLSPTSFIVVQKPYMERRTYATFCKQWPEIEFTVTSPNVSFEEYLADESLKDLFIPVMVSDVQKIKEYPAKGFQIPQEIPDTVWTAYLKLVELGYTKYVVSS